MAQQNIDFGTFPDDPSADPIRIAFQKVQQNFNEVYSGLSGASVTSVNRSAGAGITVNAPTGNVIVSANIASIQFSSTSLKIGTTPNPITNSATYTNYSQTLYVELPSTVTFANIAVTGNASITGNILSGNANLGNAATANYFIGSGANLTSIPGANVTGTVANATYALSAGTSNTVLVAAQPNITSTGTLASLSVSGNANIGNIGTAGLITATGNVRGANLVTPGVLSVTGNANVGNLGTAGLITATGNLNAGNIITTGVISATGNANVGNIGATNGVFTNVSGNGSALTSITAGNITGQVANALVAGTVYTNAQPNITSTGTLSSVSVSGNANIGNIGTAGLITAIGNIEGGNLVTAGSISATGNANVGNIGAVNGVFTNVSGNGSALTSITGANVTGTVPSATLATYATTANAVAGANVSGAVSFATTANAVAGANVSGQVNFAATANSVAGANVSGQVANATVAGTVYTNAQPNITSTGTLASLSVSGNANIGNVGTGLITATGNITGGNLATGGTLSVTGNTTLGNLSVTGALVAGDISAGSIANGTSNVDIVGVSGNVTVSVGGTSNVVVVTPSQMLVDGTLIASNIQSNGSLAGTLTTAAQPNITSTGTLSSLSVTGTANLGSVNNVKIAGGSGGQIIQTDGSGNLSFTSVITQAIPGAANTVLLSGGSNNIVAGANIKFNDPQLDITGTLSVTGNANVGNIGATNIVGTLSTAAQPNITSTGTLSALNVTGPSILNGNLNTANTSITGLLSVTGNANVGNIGATNGVFTNVSGNGSALTSIAGGNVTGAVAYATTANSVAGANVSGAVAYATTANSVAVANVSGIGNIATVNLDGSSSNVLYGNGVFAAPAGTSSNIANGTSNINIATSGGNIQFVSGGNIIANITNTSVNVNAVLYATTLSATNNLVAGNLMQAANMTVNPVSTGLQSIILGNGYSNAQASQVIDIASNVTGAGGSTIRIMPAPNTAGSTTVSILNSANVTNAQIQIGGFSNTANGTNIGIGYNSQNGPVSVGIGNNSATTSNSNINIGIGNIFNGNATTGTGNLIMAIGSQMVGPNARGYIGIGNALGGNTAVMNIGIGNAMTSVAGNATINIGIGNAGAGANAVTNIGIANNLTAGNSTKAFQVDIGTGGTVKGVINMGNYSIGTTINMSANVSVTGNILVGGIGNATVQASNVNATSALTSGGNLTLTAANSYLLISGANSGIQGTSTANTSVTLGLFDEQMVDNASRTINFAANSTSFNTSNTTIIIGRSSFPAITAVNLYGTLSATGNVTGPNITSTGYHIHSVNAAVSAAGSTQGTGTALSKEFNLVSTVASGAGVVLPTATAGMAINIVNTSANSLLVYPATGAQINALGTNVAFSQPTLGSIQYIAMSSTQWYTIGGTYA